MNDLDTGGRQVLCAAGVGRRHHVTRLGVGPFDRLSFAVTNRSRHLGLEERKGATGSAAEAIIVEFDQLAHESEALSNVTVHLLYVTKVAGVLNDDRRSRMRFGNESRQPIEMIGEPLVDVSDPRRKPLRFLTSDQDAVLLHGGSAAGRIDEDRSVARKRSHRSTSTVGRALLPTDVRVKGSATVSGVGDPIAESEGIEHVGDGSMNVTLPGVHDAPGEDPHVRCRGRRSQPRTDSHRKRTEAAGEDPETSETATHSRHRLDDPTVREGSQSETQPHGDRSFATTKSVSGVDQLAVGNSARTGRFATPTLHTRVECLDDFVVEAETIVVQGPHDLDATPRRSALVTGHPERRTVRQAQSTSDTTCEGVITHVESGHVPTVVVDRSLIGSHLHS